ncbi:WXG100 family type VII secretion target, partial [Bacillus paranthracis]|nr:WXG100 family type VII secretion target [Bacillus paranthracis]
MVQIKVTPERLEQSAKLVLETKNRLEQIHKDLYNQTEYVASMWNGATSQRFYQMFNETKPQMFNVFRQFDKIAEELMHAAEKFRNVDELYEGNLSDEKVKEGAMCGKPSEKSMLRKIWDGIYIGSGQVIGGIVEGFDSLDDTVTKENIKYAIGHPIETISTAWNTISDSFMNDFWHGDAESRTKWGTSIFMGLGLGLIGDKGISKVNTLAKGTNLTKFSEGISSVSNQLPLKERFAFAGTSGFGSNQIKTFEALQEARDTFIFSETGGRSRVKGVQEVIKDYADKVLDRV